MGTQVAIQHPKGPNGLALPLSKSLDSQALIEHRAMVAWEMEILALKTDKFGWEKGRNTPERDRLIMDWMDALQDYPLQEVQSAIRAAMDVKPGKMLNEREVLFQVHKARATQLLIEKAKAKQLPQDPERRPATAEEAMKILEDNGYRPKRMPQGEDHG